MDEIHDLNKTISKFWYLFAFNLIINSINGLTVEELSKITTSAMITNEGYPAEEHEVITEDGYILTIHRIPGSHSSTPVFVQHGLFSNSFDWVVTAFILPDAGYDVWLGNVRGNTHSRRHVTLEPSDPRFWDFGVHEMAIYDLPAIITYITDLKSSSLIYVGHSMGTVVSYIMATERPDMNDRVKVIFSFAPIAIMRKWTSPVRLMTKYIRELEGLANRLNVYEIFAQNDFVRFLVQNYCSVSSENNICVQLMFLIAGYNPSQFNYNLAPMILSHTPAGTSVKTVIHLLQIGKAGRLQNYDYGLIRNEIMYNSSEPPVYDLSKIQIPVGIFCSDNDLLCHPSDAQAFYEIVPKKVLNYRISSPLFNHNDYMWAKDAPSLVYSELVSAMKNHP